MAAIGVLLAVLFGAVLAPDTAAAGSENGKLSCVKEIPNPYSLAARRHYVLTCIAKADDLTVTKISANKGVCACRTYGSASRMKAKSRFMALCHMDGSPMRGRPCDFTEVTFETNTGTFVFTWDPDTDNVDLP